MFLFVFLQRRSGTRRGWHHPGYSEGTRNSGKIVQRLVHRVIALIVATKLLNFPD